VQTAAADYPTIRPHRLAVGYYDLFDGSLVRTHRVELDVDGARTEVPELVGTTKPALVLLNDDDLAYAKIRLDADSLAVAIDHLAHIENPLARAIVWGAAWDATRDGESAASDYVRLALGNIASETESTTIRTTLSQLGLVAKQYVAPERRTETLTRVGDALWTLATDATPGSDAQFQFVKFFAAYASTPEHAAALAGLRDGSAPLEGLEIDTDLGWEILEGLVLLGAVGQSEIDAALAADNTSNGQQAAARASATIPTAEAKRAAFDSLVDSDALPNSIVRNVTMGYLHVNDPSVLESLIEPYFAAIGDIWATRSYKIAEYIVLGLYPSPLASVALVDATTAWLAANPDVPALRRLVTENLAGVERALAVQAKDA
jgi:aminopeptidase N